ncbi:MAG: hypothetical protein ACETWQ_13415, partial [Phycisphaerae bacterium]
MRSSTIYYFVLLPKSNESMLCEKKKLGIMNMADIVLGVIFLEIVVSVSIVESAELKKSNLACNIWKQKTLTNGFFGLCERLTNNG